MKLSMQFTFPALSLTSPLRLSHFVQVDIYNNINSTLTGPPSGLSDLQLPSRLISIGGMAFLRCSSLEVVSIPASVQSIGPLAFFQCAGLQCVRWLRDEEKGNNSDGLRVGIGAFLGCPLAGCDAYDKV